MRDPYFPAARIAKPEFLGAGAWNLAGLTSVTVLFGKNGSGKSLLLRAWRDQIPQHIHYVVPERTGEIDYQPQYQTQQFDAEQRRQNSARNFVSEYRRQIVARIQTYFAVRGNNRTGTPPGNPTELEQFLSMLLPDFSVELIPTKNPPFAISRSIGGQQVTAADQLSSGEAQLLTLGLDILTIGAIWDIERNPRRLMLVDEPDAHIHPDLQVRFADFLIRVATKYELQLVVASHSTTLLAALGQFAGARASVVYLDRTSTEVNASPFTPLMKELAACLGGHALMGSLFSAPLLLVEGDDDYRIWSQVPRHHVTNFAVIPSNGDEIRQYQRTLERLFSVLRTEPSTASGYALIDGDKQKC